MRKHGKEKRRVWRKLHLAIYAATQENIAAEVGLDCVGDNEVLPTWLNPLRRKIKQVSALKSGDLATWKQDSDYHKRLLSETTMYRSKQLLSLKLTLRDYNAQVGEVLANVKVINKVIRLGMRVRKPTGQAVKTKQDQFVSLMICLTRPFKNDEFSQAWNQAKCKYKTLFVL